MADSKAFRRWLFTEVLGTVKNPILSFNNWYGQNQKALQEEEENKTYYVYVATNRILEQGSLYKIGITSDLYTQLTRLNSSSPFDFSYMFIYPIKNCILMDKYIYYKLRNKKYRRDFFILQKEDLDNIKKHCFEYENKELYFV